MVLVTTTLDAYSPLIDYQPREAWVRGGADGDPYRTRYQDGTFVFSLRAPGASATLNFTGTEVHIYGAYRSNSGPYSVTLDGVSSGYMRTNGSTPDVHDQLFKVELYGATGLTPGAHQVTITNEWGSASGAGVRGQEALDVDYITFTSDVESDDSAVVQGEQADFFEFVPEAAWGHVQGDDYNGGAEHFTTQSGASVSLTFAGDRVALYGSFGPDFALYTAQLDDGPTALMNASRPVDPAFQQLLFYATSLGTDARHNLTLTSMAQGAGKFAVDYAKVDRASNTLDSAVAKQSAAQDKATG
ncbi:hypothetical protein HDZ31DRAFT_61375 [Schizophyllum fasciatum]